MRPHHPHRLQTVLLNHILPHRSRTDAQAGYFVCLCQSAYAALPHLQHPDRWWSLPPDTLFLPKTASQMEACKYWSHRTGHLSLPVLHPTQIPVKDKSVCCSSVLNRKQFFLQNHGFHWSETPAAPSRRSLSGNHPEASPPLRTESPYRKCRPRSEPLPPSAHR